MSRAGTVLSMLFAVMLFCDNVAAVDFDAISAQPLRGISREKNLIGEDVESKVLPEHYQVYLNEGRNGLHIFPDFSLRTVKV